MRALEAVGAVVVLIPIAWVLGLIIWKITDRGEPSAK